MSPIFTTPAYDGTLLANYRWAPAPHAPVPIRGPGISNIYLLHGLNEHAGRYDPLARWLSARGWTVGAHDHRGHGHSGGPSATLRHEDDLVVDTVERLRAWSDASGRPPIVLAHSMGALVAARIALRQLVPLDALVLSSPPFMVQPPHWVRYALRWLSRYAPDLRVPYRLAPMRISHDAAVVNAYRNDPLIRRYMTGRLANFVQQNGAATLRDAHLLSCPTLLLVAGDDAIVAAEGSRQFSQQAPTKYLTLRWYDTAWHELFNELPALAAPVYADLDAWLTNTARRLSLPSILTSSAEVVHTP